MRPHLSRVRPCEGVAGGGDTEQFEDLLLWGVEFGFEGCTCWLCLRSSWLVRSGQEWQQIRASIRAGLG
jgi:hypothetical protein